MLMPIIGCRVCMLLQTLSFMRQLGRKTAFYELLISIALHIFETGAHPVEKS